MKVYRELYFKGDPKNLSEFVEQIGTYVTGDWKQEKQLEHIGEYLLIDYIGNFADKARVSIYLGDDLKTGKIRAGNIVPLEKSTLNIDEYNSVLLRFYDDVIKPYKECNTKIEIPEPSDDTFDPLSMISEMALVKLKSFCVSANKSTASAHSSDQERWFNFICQTVDDEKIFDGSILARFLQDESYWGKKQDGFTGVIGQYAWDEEQAHKLAVEYETLSAFLIYYKRTRLS